MRNYSAISKRNAQIEGLRGISILVVVSYHVFDRYQQIYCNTSIKLMDMWGSIGVTIFLMISGLFLVSEENPRKVYPKSCFFTPMKLFFWKVVRLWPTYLVCVLITYTATRFWELPERTVGLKELIANLFLINRFLNLAYVDGAHWYLGVLLSVSLVTTLFSCFEIENNPLSYFVWVLLELFVDVFFPTRNMYPIGGPFVGCVCIGIAIKQINKLDQNKCAWMLLCLCSLATTYLSRGTSYTIELICVAPIVWFAYIKKNKILEFKPLMFLGMISYPLYLIHQNIAFMIQNFLVETTGKYSFAWGIIAMGIVFAIGTILYYGIEKPVQKQIKMSFLRHQPTKTNSSLSH